MISDNKDNIVAYLISEEVNRDSNIKILSSNSSGVKIEADLQDAAELNRNARRYRKPVLNAGLTRENITELISRKSWFGEAGHPINPTPQRQMTVVQENISHRILSWDWRGSIVHGIVKTAPFPMGLAMRDCILDEDPMESAFSLRACGPIKETTEGKIVQDPLVVVTYDWVFYPSHRKAYQTKILDNIRASGNSLTESAIPIIDANIINLQESAIQYIKDQSKNYKIISELMESNGINSQLSEDNKMIILTEKNNENSTDKIVIGVEEYITREINDYLSKF